MKKQVQRIIQIALMLFVFGMMMPQLMAQSIGSKIQIDNNSNISYWNGTTWITVAPGLPGQSLQFTNGVPAWINNPNGITTNAVTNIIGTNALGGGNVISDGGAPITAKGVCWSTSHNPKIANSFSADDIGKGSFTSTLAGLVSNTTYYVKAYATNSVGTAYGNEVSFINSLYSAVGDGLTDIDGNIYSSIIIGKQEWMRQNLNVTHYSNGDAIPNVTDNADWSNLTTGAYCNYDNNANNAAIYGKLYNFYTVSDTRNLCPTDWHVPADAEWLRLINYLGGENVAGGKLKEAGITNWQSPNTGATNESGFTALPAGIRTFNSEYGYKGTYGYWWSSYQYDITKAWSFDMGNNFNDVNKEVFFNQSGFSVRCLKD